MPEIEDVRRRVREFMEAEVDPVSAKVEEGGGDRKAWIEATRPVWKQFEAQIGPELIARVQRYAQ